MQSYLIEVRAKPLSWQITQIQVHSPLGLNKVAVSTSWEGWIVLLLNSFDIHKMCIYMIRESGMYISIWNSKSIMYGYIGYMIYVLWNMCSLMHLFICLFIYVGYLEGILALVGGLYIPESTSVWGRCPRYRYISRRGIVDQSTNCRDAKPLIDWILLIDFGGSYWDILGLYNWYWLDWWIHRDDVVFCWLMQQISMNLLEVVIM